MKYRFSLTSKGVKELAVCVTIAILSFSGVLIYFYRQVPWYAILFAVIVSAFLCFGSTVLFLHRIVLNKTKNEITLGSLKRKKVILTDIEKIEVDIEHSHNKNKYCFLTIRLKSGAEVKCSGYISILNSHDVQRTRLIVDEINKLI